MRGAACVAAVLAMALAAEAQVLPLPDEAEQTAEVRRPADTIHLPEGPVTDGDVPMLTLDGAITSRAWRLPTRGTQAWLAPLRAALEAEGWEVTLSCAAAGCGGFDFRFAVPVLPAPAMFVDLFDFRYLLARRGAGAETEHAMLFVSRGGERVYVQLTRVGPVDAVAPAPEEAKPASQPPRAALADALERTGHAVLRGLDFASGDRALAPGPHPALAALAAFLDARPEARIVLVGHTDTVGPLEANIALSRRRAEVVRARLVEAHGVDGARIDARGVGYLAPAGTNDSEAGREANRRVEAVLLPE